MPIAVPSNRIVANSIGFPLSSVIVPPIFTLVWAKAGTEDASKIAVRNFPKRMSEDKKELLMMSLYFLLIDGYRMSYRIRKTEQNSLLHTRSISAPYLPHTCSTVFITV